HGQRAAARAERHLGPRRLELAHDDERRRQRGVPAQLDLHGRREPAQAERVALAVEERRLGEVVLGRDVLHERLGQRALRRTYGRGFTRERAVREGVDLIERQRRHLGSMPRTVYFGAMASAGLVFAFVLSLAPTPPPAGAIVPFASPESEKRLARATARVDF